MAALFVMIRTKCKRLRFVGLLPLDEARRAFPGRSSSPIEVHDLGGGYFVADGHHRIAPARERGMEFSDAEVTPWCGVSRLGDSAL